MFRGRRQLQRRDRESGLAFSWRVPVSSTGSFVVAFLMVALVAVGLATAVRVRIGGGAREEPRQGTLVLVPQDRGGAALERRAIEAGPFPSRWNPAADPAYVALRREALRAATESGVPYRPQMVEGGESVLQDRGTPEFEGSALPALPGGEALDPPAGPREVTLGVRTLDGAPGVRFTHAVLAFEAPVAGELVGRRFVVEYDAEGRVLDVVALTPRPGQSSVVQWLLRGRVAGNEGSAGWMSVETGVAR